MLPTTIPAIAPGESGEAVVDDEEELSAFAAFMLEDALAFARLDAFPCGVVTVSDVPVVCAVDVAFADVDKPVVTAKFWLDPSDYPM
jgi:hypothetical protein